MKPYLLIASSAYYPDFGTGDWVKCFKTKEEAEAFISYKQEEPTLFSQGPRKGQVKKEGRFFYFTEDGGKFDTYEIVDLKDWIYCDEESADE